jgi:hypothetical protein
MNNIDTRDTWDQIEGKLLELRVLTNANWKNSEWELAALGERILRSVEASKAQSESIRQSMGIKTTSFDMPKVPVSPALPQ